MENLTAVSEELEYGLAGLEEAVESLGRAVDTAERGTFVPTPQRFPPSGDKRSGSDGSPRDFDRLAVIVWNLHPDEAAPLITHLRRVSTTDALAGRLGLLLRLLLPEALPAAVEAIGDDLPDAVSAMVACDVVTFAEARDLADALDRWDGLWTPPAAEVLNRLADVVESADLRREIEAGLAAMPMTAPSTPAPEPGERAFGFTDLGALSDAALIETLKAVDKRTLGIAMRSAPTETMRRVFAVMTDRSAAFLRGDMQGLDDVGVDAVADARRAVVDAVLDLAASGAINLPNGTAPPAPDA